VVTTFQSKPPEGIGDTGDHVKVTVLPEVEMLTFDDVAVEGERQVTATATVVKVAI
jgi:hypothetical protein